jgi:hypothetical protein
MNATQARDAINGAAIVVGGLYFYRKLIEPQLGSPTAKQPASLPAAAAQIVGVGPLASTGRFVVGFGFTFLALSLVEGASPELAGSFALLIAAGAILGNGLKAAEDLQSQLNEKQRGLQQLSGLAEPNTPTVQVVSWEPATMPTAKRTKGKTSA